MSDEAAMENYESICDNVRRIKKLEKAVKVLESILEIGEVE